jgi:hypothetical protein
MEMTTTRRTFLTSAAALAAWPADLFGAPAGKKPARRRNDAWEKPDGSATDGVMVRRLYLDLAGRIPTKDEAQAYVLSGNPNKRESLVEHLLASKEFADFWAMRFCDILRVKSEFPINLWPNAVYVYHARIRKFVETNEPWDAFGRALITSQGSDFRDAEVNFFRATDHRTPEGWAEAVAQTFLGIPPAELPAKRKEKIAAHLKCLKIKNTREWKEEIVYADGDDRRGELCDMLFVDGRQEVADAFLKQVRGWVFGPKAASAKSGGELRLKDVLRGITTSREYGRGSVTGGFPARRIEAEVLDDAFCTLSEGMRTRNYQSPAPEPFTFLPKERPTVCVEDGSISSGFLTLFGRPARDTGLPEERGGDVTAKQRLYLFNSGSLHNQIVRMTVPGGWKVNGGPNPIFKLPLPQRVDDLYWRILARPSLPRERQTVMDEWKRRGGGKNKNARFIDLMRDVAWCLINTKEFIYRI